jgi:hypothetical protein
VGAFELRRMLLERLHVEEEEEEEETLKAWL